MESTWDTPMGTIVRIVLKTDVEFTKEHFDKTGTPLGKKAPKKKLTLEGQLIVAEKAEEYEECARLQKEIEAKNSTKVASENINNKGIAKKDKKDLKSENLDNKGLPDDTEWNF